MKLSVVVVSHNMCKLLDAALTALIKATKSVEKELFVVDNASTDGTSKMLQANFPQVNVISNEKYEATSVTQNQAIKRCRGEYVLLVSADTICNTDSIEKMLKFMDLHTQIGGMSPRMITPRGNFIAESKYGIDKRWAAFLNLTGLCKLFPHSKAFSRARYDWVTEFETGEMVSLNASWMMLRHSVLNKIGLFDERFLLSGHNVDLSRRIYSEGYKNYYYSHTYIIDYQRDRLAKFSLDRLKYFYGAMLIFAVKYLFKVPVVQIKRMGQLVPTSYEIER